MRAREGIETAASDHRPDPALARAGRVMAGVLVWKTTGRSSSLESRSTRRSAAQTSSSASSAPASMSIRTRLGEVHVQVADDTEVRPIERVGDAQR